MKKKKWAIVLAVILALAVAVVFGVPMLLYSVAQNRTDSGDYESAIAIYEKLGNYRDSAQRKAETEQARDYEAACAALTEGDYDRAEEGFAALGDYRDSAELKKEASYQKAVSLLSYGTGTDYEAISQARDLFAELGTYQDAADYLSRFRMVNTCITRTALESGDSIGKEYQWYDARGRLTGMGDTCDIYAYDDQDRLIFDTDQQIVYDEQGRVYQKISDRRVDTFRYDDQGRVSQSEYSYTTSGKNVEHTFRYKSKYSDDLLIEETKYDNDMLWSINAYAYDDQGRVVENFSQNYNGKSFSTDYTFRYEYDTEGRLLRKACVYPDNAKSYVDTYTYGYIWAPDHPKAE